MEKSVFFFHIFLHISRQKYKKVVYYFKSPAHRRAPLFANRLFDLYEKGAFTNVD